MSSEAIDQINHKLLIELLCQLVESIILKIENIGTKIQDLDTLAIFLVVFGVWVI